VLAEAVGFLGAKKSSARLPSEGKSSSLSHVVDLRHVKDPKIYVEVGIYAKLPDNFPPTVPPFAARISLVVANVQAPGGESGNV